MKLSDVTIPYGHGLVSHSPPETLKEYRHSFPRQQKIIYRILSGIQSGFLVICDHTGKETHFGNPHDDLSARCKIHHPQFFSRLLSGGALALGESYMEGWWDVDEDRLADFFRILFLNRIEYTVKGSLLARAASQLYRFLSNPRHLRIARDDIEKHYDIGNGLFKYMLDNTMTYSCGYQKSRDDSLQTMQEQKYARIYKKLGLEKGGSLVDIGCGWGGMLIYAAKRNAKITGTGITLSTEQYNFARDRITQEGLSDRVEVILCDYRKLEGSFDFLVSIGMFEHVGKESYPTFFQKVRELLRPGGVALLHTIGVEEDPDIPPDPWIEKYIFPGNRLPRLEELTRELRRCEFTAAHIENLRPHYALTLERWRENFIEKWPKIRSLGFDNRFYRMWTYYLQVSEACFCESTMELYQILFCKGRKWSFPLRFDFE